MAIPQPNTQFEIRKSGRATVLVDGVPMVGVVGVQLIQPTVEKAGPDGWTIVEKSGSPVCRIDVNSRFVNCVSEAEDAGEA